MSKPLQITSKNVDRVFREAIRQLKEKDTEPIYDPVFLLARYKRKINLRRYRGLGRPRNSDYDIVPIDWKGLFKKQGYKFSKSKA